MFSACLCARFMKILKTTLSKKLDSSKGTTLLGVWYPKRTGIETIVYDKWNCIGYKLIRKAQVVLALLYLLTQEFSKTLKDLILVLNEEAHQQAPLEHANSRQQRYSFYQHCHLFNEGSIDFGDNSIHYVRYRHTVIHHHRLCKIVH